MLDQRLREGTEAVKAALADAVAPAAEELLLVESFAPKEKVGWRGPLIAAATAVVVLAVVAVAALLFRGDGFTGEPAGTLPAPAVSTTVTTAPVATTVATTPAFIGDAVTSWQVTKLVEPWVHSIVDVASLPGGGFVVAVDHSDASVLWSPDGTDWVEADPQRHVSAEIPGGLQVQGIRWGQQPQVISVSGERVFILDETILQVWVGDLAAKAWEPVRLDTAGLSGSIEAAAIASNDREVLVVAKWTPTGVPLEGPFDQTDYVVWLVDQDTGGVERQIVPWEFTDVHIGLAAVWFQDRWVIATGDATVVSRDGITWTIGQKGGDPSDPEGGIVTSLVAGPDGLITTVCQMHHFTFYSEDGLEWTRVPENEQFPEQAAAGHEGAAYSDELGFVMVFAEGGHDDDPLPRLDYSQDGRNWSSMEVGLGVNHDVFNLAASGTSIFIDHRLGASLMTPE
jgi:hypothetical protein